MKTLQYFLLLSILLTSSIYSQSELNDEEKLIKTDTITVNPELPQYIVKVYTNDEDESDSIIKIYTVGDTTLLQSFDLDHCCLNLYDELIDINFDGYNDLEISGFWHNWITGVSSFWLFNPELKVFEKSDEFAEFGEITIDKENQIITHWVATAGYDKNSWSSTYKVVDNHLILIEEEEWYRYDGYRKVLQGDSMVTVSRSYVEEKQDSMGTRIDNLVVHYLFIINTENLIYGKLRPVKRVWQWEYEGSKPEEVGKRLVQEYWNQPFQFVFEKEIVYEYSKDENNNIYVQETVGDIINGEWVTKSKPKERIK